MDWVAIIGLATAFVAATIGLAQTDIKKVFAYSTVSQLGYMFVGLGVGAFSAGIFHLMTHAFFKALLFLGAGSVIHALSGEQDMRRMGGLRTKTPVTFWTMLAAAAAISLLVLLHRLTSGRTAWMLTLLFALGTANWSTSSQALWQHTFGQLAIIGCLYSIERWSASPSEARWYWIAGAFAACALAIRPTDVALMPALAAALWLRPARLVDYPRLCASVLGGGSDRSLQRCRVPQLRRRISGKTRRGLL